MASRLSNLPQLPLDGLLSINGEDAWTSYGVFLAEARPGEQSNYSALMALPTMRPLKAVSYADEDGERLPETLPRHVEPRDLELSFALIAEGKEAFLRQHSAFVDLLRSGWLTLEVHELDRSYKVYYLSGGEYKQLTPIEGSPYVSARLVVRLREPNPTALLTAL